MVTIRDIIRKGNPTLHTVAEEVPVPTTKEDRQPGEDMLTFLRNSQSPVKAEESQLRDGAGLAAPQLDISRRIVVVHVPSNNPKNETSSLSMVMYNLKILSRSVQGVCLGEGEGCLPAGRNVPGYVVRHNKITVSRFDMAGEKHKARLKDYEAIVVQYEINHINDIMFYDHINKENLFASKEDILVIE